MDTFCFSQDALDLAQSWQQLARVRALCLPEQGLADICRLDNGDQVLRA